MERTKQQFELKEALAVAEYIANANADGHLTIMKFTTGWKVMFDTPNLDTGEGRDQVSDLSAYPTLLEALDAEIWHTLPDNWKRTPTVGVRRKLNP